MFASMLQDIQLGVSVGSYIGTPTGSRTTKSRTTQARTTQSRTTQSRTTQSRMTFPRMQNNHECDII